MITNAEAENRGYIRNREWKSGTSFPEQFIYRCFLQLFPRTDNRYIESLCNMEFDVFVPELNLRVEFSGEYWHSSERKEQRDQFRRDFCLDHNMVYVEIIDRTDACDFRQETNGKHIVYTLHTGGNLQKMIPMLVSIIKDIVGRFNIIDTDIDYIRAIYEAYVFSAKYQYKTVKDAETNLVGISYIDNDYKSFNYFYKDSSTKMTGERISLYARNLPKEVIHTLDFHNSVPRIVFKDPVTNNMGTSGEILRAREQRVEQKEQELVILEETLNNKLNGLMESIKETEERNNKLSAERDSLQEDVEKLSVYKDFMIKELSELRLEILRQINKEISIEYEALNKEKAEYREKIQSEYNEKLEAEKKDIARCEKSKYDYQIEKMTEENRKLMRQLMSAKCGLA